MNYPLLQVDRGIIIAADVPTIDDLRALLAVSAQVPEVVAIKIGFSLALRHGLRSIVAIVGDASDLPVIYDHQKAGTDIPAMGQPFADTCRDAGVKGVILFPLSGPKTLEGFITAAFDCELTPIVGLLMTHFGYLESQGGFIVNDASKRICRIALDAGIRHFVLPGNKTDIVRDFSDGLLKPARPVSIMMPGIGSQGGSITDAFAAAAEHHAFAIIGSAIYQASDPKAVLERFAVEIRGDQNDRGTNPSPN